jgi:ferric-dicitrate binding protein FerR (iron transport regulator)
MDYRSFTLSDFVFDEAFRRWVLDPDDESRRFWTDFLAAYPGLRPTVAEARLLVRYGAVPPAVPDDQLDRSWNRLRESLNTKDVAELRVRPHSGFGREAFLRSWLGIAASVALLLLAGLGLWRSLRSGAEQTYRTAFGETRAFTLPDGSHVTLNGNSRLRVRSDGPAQTPREAWLEGEAFFAVRHQADHRRFVVHTPRLDVQVLGTEFNVYTRHEVVKVLLESGQVRLSAAEASPGDTVLMKPGQLFVTSPQGFGTLRPARAERHTAWTENRLQLDHTSLAELVSILHDTYGVDVAVRDPALLQLRASGSMPLSTADDFLNQISRLFTLKIEKTADTIRLEKR